MKSLSAIDPLQIIITATTVKEDYHLEQFNQVMQKLYRYRIFKPMLDLVTTKALQGSLVFKVQDQKLFDLDEGNCRTIEGSVVNKLFNKVKTHNNYVITIKKISADVIIHEISHMIEKEITDVSVNSFAQELLSDLAVRSGNVSLQAAVEQILYKEVNSYPDNQRSSELFARYFQLLAMAKEISGHGAIYGYSIFDVYRLFLKTEKWLWDNLYRSILPQINTEVAKQSQVYIQDIENITHDWAKERIQSIHHRTGSPRWSKTLKSIKDDPFQ